MPNAEPQVNLQSGTLDRALRPMHARWLDEARRFLSPACETGADFWTRWSAVRYLADAFLDQLDWERALVGELRPLLDPAAAERLVRGGDDLLRMRLELDRIGRRRGTNSEFAAHVQPLLERLGRWCAEIELAARGMALDDLAAEGAAIVAHLKAAS